MGEVATHSSVGLLHVRLVYTLDEVAVGIGVEGLGHRVVILGMRAFLMLEGGGPHPPVWLILAFMAVLYLLIWWERARRSKR